MRKRFHELRWTQDRIRTQRSVQRMMKHQRKTVEVLEDSLTRPALEVATHVTKPWTFLRNPV